MRITIITAALAITAAAFAPAAAQDAPATPTAQPTETVAVNPWAEESTHGAAAAGASQETGVQAPAAASGLQRATPPRTLRAYWHVFIAFAVAWVLLFGYVVTLARRFRRLEEQVAAAR
ncbi:MAG TPA: CcmD family protein [Longimicrobium sp.]|nr:CcmD family protein [Longimicrobium sp.]